MSKLLAPDSALPSTFATRSAAYMARHGCTPAEIRETLIDECELPADEADQIVDQLISNPEPDARYRPLLVAA